MTTPENKPYDASLSSRPAVRIMQIACYVLLATALIFPAVQFQHKMNKALAKGHTRGALARWQPAIGEFWAGKNIYRRNTEPKSRLSGNDIPQEEQADEGGSFLHPNMPFVVILLTPLAMLKPAALAAVVNVLKILIVLACGLMAARVADHKQHRLADWVLGLGMLWALLPIIGDIQHCNTNIFILGAIVLHLWLYRRGRDYLAGTSLALAICLKMTPALFVLYWLYQRNWKLLAGTIAAMAIFTIVVPSVAVGPAHAMDLTSTWLDNLIVPGLLKAAPYPTHINQSLPAMLDRFFQPQGSPAGNIFWNPDDTPDYAMQKDHAWITIVSLPPEAVKLLAKLAQLAIVALMAWAIGWRKLPRDDGRRSLHYAMILLAMMLLNQRTWDHHLAVLLPATVAIWYGIVYGSTSITTRKVAAMLTVLGGIIYLFTRQEVLRGLATLRGYNREAAKVFADAIEAYGPGCVYLLLMFAAAVMLAASVRKLESPFADKPQRLTEQEEK